MYISISELHLPNQYHISSKPSKEEALMSYGKITIIETISDPTTGHHEKLSGLSDTLYLLYELSMLKSSRIMLNSSEKKIQKV
jgi:hypothetical protein